MQWTKSQRKLMRIARTPVKRGLALDVVLAGRLSGLTTVAAHLWRNQEGAVRVLKVPAFSPWDVVVSACDHAGTPVGFGYAKSLRLALTELSQAKELPLCLLLEHAECMSIKDMSLLCSLLDCAVSDAGIAARAMLLCNKVQKWDTPKNAWGKPTWPDFPAYLVQHQRAYKRDFLQFDREDLVQVRAPKDVIEMLEDGQPGAKERKAA